ncbi:hypothetical protein SAMN02745824_2207 [Parasphingorhabdus marina DSM 22363]|uniref:Uncharacterized protein n=1 Tax=Parasphingorhabdus marina DSM 22363 TaxID=1123272 RepID=A0A1N6F2V9_9SPHN|nr:hypothetical protein [Parasphingorhabdus marina]SIN89603.1 hypothetical protein SAMN02745824_2207 [Parasphingorhabdus marina DSM 22363]
MRFGKVGMAAVAAASLVSAPVFAQAVQPVSSQVERVGAATSDESELEGGSGIIIAVLAAAAVIAGIIIAADGSDDTPTSP